MQTEAIYSDSIAAASRGYDRKKAMIFMALSGLLPYIVRMITSAATMSFRDLENHEAFGNWMLDNVNSAGIYLPRLIIPIVFGYFLTRSLTGTVQFLAISRLGAALAVIPERLFDVIMEIIFPMGRVSAVTYSEIMMVGTALFTVVATAFSCLLYDRIIGKEKITPVSQREYKSVRTRMICAYIVLSVLVSVLASSVSLVAALIEAEPDSFLYQHNVLINCIVTLITEVICTFAAFYLGYTLARDRDDGLKFLACYCFPHIITSGIMLVISTAAGTVIRLTGLGTYFADMFGMTVNNILTISSSALSSIPTAIIEIVLLFAVIKYFFPQAEVKAVTETEGIPDGIAEEVVTEESAEEAETISIPEATEATDE